MPKTRKARVARLRTRTSKSIPHPKTLAKQKTISPETLLSLMGKPRVAIVNTLDTRVSISSVPPNASSYFGKTFIKKSCKQIQSFKVIVLYCANDTCSASHTYAKKLISKCPGAANTILMYAGGVYEWALLSFAFPNKYGLYNMPFKTMMDKIDTESYFARMSHRPEGTGYPDAVEAAKKDRETVVQSSADTCENAQLAGKVCVVTGGTSGLGLEVVRQMLRNGARHVTLTYYHNKSRAKRVHKELEAAFGNDRFYVLRADARTVEGNRLTFDRKLRRTRLGLNVGPIDCVDINAGIYGPGNMHKKHIFNISERDYRATMDTNLTGYFLGLKYFAIQAIENEVMNAAAVCIKSIYGSTGSLFSNTAYQTSKHGVLGLVQQSAIELARANPAFKIKHPIRVNAVSPTFTNTALTKAFLEKKIISDAITGDTPMGKLANKKNVGEAVLFLLSDRAQCITGVDLPVDCGVLAESIPTYAQVEKMNKAGIHELSCCGAEI